MAIVTIGESMRIRGLAEGVGREIAGLEKLLSHRGLWLDKAGDEGLIAYVEKIDFLLDRIMGRVCAMKEAALALKGSPQ